MSNSKPCCCLLKFLLLATLLLIAGCSSARAQLGPVLNPAYAPQARSEEELDAYLEIITDSDSRTIISNVDHFAQKYPHSEMLGVAYGYQMLAYKHLGDFEGMVRAGERSLQLQPGNVNSLLTLAASIPDHVARRRDSDELLQRAKKYATQALQELAGMRIPKEISLKRWKIMRGQMESTAHEALGKIAIETGNLQVAVSEMETAALHNPIPQGTQFYRLGTTYALSGERKQAATAFRRAAELGPGNIRKLAEYELTKLEGGGSHEKN